MTLATIIPLQAPAPNFDNPMSAPRILVVDDEPLVAHTLGLIFRQSGFDAVSVLSADQAVESFRAIAPDLVLCDIDMPGRDGISLMHDLGRELPQCPILVLTGFYSSLARVHECARTLNQPVNVLTKPCQPDDLLRAATDILKVA